MIQKIAGRLVYLIIGDGVDGVYSGASHSLCEEFNVFSNEQGPQLFSGAVLH